MSRHFFKSHKKFKWLTIIVVASVLPLTQVHAEKTKPSSDNEIAEILVEAQDAYEKGYLKLSATRMNQALSLIRQMETLRAQKIFPAPLPGWEVTDGTDALRNFKSLGIGSIFATGQSYSKGEQSVQIVLVQKPSSPQPLFDILMAGLLMPRPGMEKISVQGYTAHFLCKNSVPGECDMSVPVEADYVLMVNGKGASREILLEYTNAIKFDLLKSFR